MTFLNSGLSLPQKLALLTATIFLLGAGTGLATQNNHQACGLPQMQTTAPTGIVVVKMAPGPMAHKSMAPDRLARAVAHLLPDAPIEPRFLGLSKSLSEGDLGRYFQINAHKLEREQLLKLVGALNADPAVEVAFLEPVAVPAALGFDAFTGAVPAHQSAGISKSDAKTPDYESDQGYLDDAPLGVGARSMRGQDGSLGADITVIDVEGGWLWTHEDLPSPAAELGVQIDDLGWRNHGTAVLSEIRGEDNDYGVTGIAPDCAVGCSSIGGGLGTTGALAAAMDALQPGDLILIELHAPGPNSYEGGGQFGYVPMEYWPDNFDVIRAATAKGIIVCEAAGNGFQYLDGSEFLGLFDRTQRDSGAIMCGATAGSDLYSAEFSNHGSRVDLNGWGWSVYAAGYGDLQAGEETEWYTAQFSGTSSASPIVTGSVTSLQGMVRERFGFDLDARLARDLLLETGTAMESGHLIGTRPDLVAAFAHADTIVGLITGTVTDQDTGLPISGALVQVSDHGSFTMTDENGQWHLPLVIGAMSVEFSSYLYHSATAGSTILAGQTVSLDQALAPLDLIDITGTVYGAGGPLVGVLVSPVDQPVSSDVSDPSGHFHIPGVPALYDYTFLFDGAGGYGAQVEMVSTAGLVNDAVITTQLPVISEDFGSGSGGFVAHLDLWTHGAPPVEVTGGAFASDNCWGIGMSGEYGDDQADTLLSPVYNLSGVSGSDYFLSFHYFSATETGFDGVNLEIWDDDQFIMLEPMEGYTDPSLGGLGGAAGWSGNSGRWHGTVFDISSHTQPDFRFRLVFGSDAGVVGQGFYMDGIAFGDGRVLSPVPNTNAPSPLQPHLKAWPNPFNPQVNLEYAVTRPGHLHVDVFDLRGNRVRTLLNAPVVETRGTLNWDGRGDDGRTLPSGIYLVRLTGPDNQIASQRVVLAK